MPILEPELEDLIDASFQGHSNNFGVATPGIVQSVTNVGGVTRRITVQPAVHKLVESEDDEDLDDVEEYSPLQEVPVLWPVGRGFQMKGTLLPGDTVMLVCLDRDISGWRRTGAASEPDDARIHDWSNAVAIPGLVPDTSPYPEPTDSAALASRLDKLIAVLKGWTVSPNDGGQALKTTMGLVFPGYPASPGSPTPLLETSSGSAVLKLGS